MTVNRLLRAIALCLLAAAAQGAAAQTTVKDAWVRGTVEPQRTTGAFMKITSAQGGKLVAVESPVAGVVEVHAMSMQGDVMSMHAVPDLALPPGRTVDLKPGGYHVMMMGLKQALKAGDVVALTLVIEGMDGKRETIEVKAPVRALGAMKH